MKATQDFTHISADQWLQTIQKELKGRAWEDSFVWLTDDISIPPAFHHEDIKGQYWTPVRGHYHDYSLSGLNFEARQLSQKNKYLLQALNHGLQSPGIVKQKGAEEDVKILLEGVQLDLVEWHLFGFSKEDGLPKLFTNRGVTYFLHPLPSVDTSVQSRMDGFIASLRAFDSSEENLDTFTHHCRVGASYLTEIAVLRAMRRIFENYSAARKANELKFLLSTTNAVNPLSEDLYTQMIANSAMAMSAMIAGADRVSLDVFFEDKQALQYRMAINLIQILKMESHLDKVRDPLSGSYWIEKATDELASSYWKKFQAMY